MKKLLPDSRLIKTVRFLKATACALLPLGMTVASAQVYQTPPPNAPPPPPPPAPYAYGAPPPRYYAPDPSSDYGFYIGADLGPSFMPDIQSSRFGFPGTFRTDPGVRFGVEPGFNFVSNQRVTLGAEFETGVIYNYIYSVRNAGAPTPLRGDFYQVPVLGNLILKLKVDPFITPYIGVSGGGDYSSASIHMRGFFGSRTTDDEFDPAVQGIVGVRFRINPFTEVGVGYKFLGAFPDQGNLIQSHTVSANFTMRF